MSVLICSHKRTTGQAIAGRLYEGLKDYYKVFLDSVRSMTNFATDNGDFWPRAKNQRNQLKSWYFLIF